MNTNLTIRAELNVRQLYALLYGTELGSAQPQARSEGIRLYNMLQLNLYNIT